MDHFGEVGFAIMQLWVLLKNVIANQAGCRRETRVQFLAEANHIHNDFRAHTAFYTNDSTTSFCRRFRGQTKYLTIHFHAVPRSRMHEVSPHAPRIS
jgi:hypothetical protein